MSFHIFITHDVFTNNSMKMIYMIHKPTGKLQRNREPKFDIKDFKKNNEFKYEELYEALHPEKFMSWDLNAVYSDEFSNRISERIIDDMTNCYRESIS